MNALMNADFTLNRRQMLASAVALSAVSAWAAPHRPLVEVWKDPSCGCCKDWVAVLEKAGFDVHVDESGNKGARAQLGMPAKLASCHTARVQGYVLEGHVPVSEIQRLLRDKPKVLGLAVPGMHVGSPGMDGPLYQGRKDPYDVLLVLADGSSSVYKSYR